MGGLTGFAIIFLIGVIGCFYAIYNVLKMQKEILKVIETYGEVFIDINKNNNIQNENTQNLLLFIEKLEKRIERLEKAP